MAGDGIDRRDHVVQAVRPGSPSTELCLNKPIFGNNAWYAPNDHGAAVTFVKITIWGRLLRILPDDCDGLGLAEGEAE